MLLYDFARPSVLFELLVFSVCCLGVLRSRGSLRLLFAISGLCLVAIAWSPFPYLVLKPLETRIHPRSLPAGIKGIILLGGAFNMRVAHGDQPPALNYRGQRIIAFIALATRYPKAQLMFSGGNAAGGQPTEASLAKALFAQMGINPGRIRFESRSRNTHENAVLSFGMVHPPQYEKWALVTSAADMPRAYGCFKRLGWNVLPVPVDFHAQGSLWSPPGLAEGLIQLDWAFHEWLGLVYYRMRGWTPSVFPTG